MNIFETAQIASLLLRGPLLEPPPVNAGPGPDTFVVSGHEIAALRALRRSGDPTVCPLVDHLLRKVDADASRPIRFVTDKTALPPSGDIHDYYSHAKYFWKSDGDDAENMKYKRRDGDVNPIVYSDQYDLSALTTLSDVVLTLALAAYVHDDAECARRAARFLAQWFIEPETRMNPNFKFAQMIPGESDGRWVGLVEARSFVYLIDSAQILYDMGAWSPEDRASLRQWFSEFLVWLRRPEHLRERARSKNNLALWYDVQCVVYARFTGDDALAADIARHAVTHTIPAQIDRDGRMQAEDRRARPHDYLAFNLLAMMDLMHAGEPAAKDLWAIERRDGENLENALNWLRSAPGVRDAADRMQAEAKLRLLTRRVEHAEAHAGLIEAELTTLRGYLEGRERLLQGARAEAADLRARIEAGEQGVIRATADAAEARAALAAAQAATEAARADAQRAAAEAGETRAALSKVDAQRKASNDALRRVEAALDIVCGGERPAGAMSSGTSSGKAAPAGPPDAGSTVATQVLASRLPCFFKKPVAGSGSMTLSGIVVLPSEDASARHKLSVFVRYHDASGKDVAARDGEGEPSRLYPTHRMLKLALGEGGRFSVRVKPPTGAASAEFGFAVVAARAGGRLFVFSQARDGAQGPVKAMTPRPAAAQAPEAGPRDRAAAAGPVVLRRSTPRTEGSADRFVLYRIIGNDLPPRHRAGQSTENLRFILDNEPEFEGCEKRWVLNRIVDPDVEGALAAMLEGAGRPCLRLGYDPAAYAAQPWQVEPFKDEGVLFEKNLQSLGAYWRRRALEVTYAFKNLYVMNNNGARNAALREGRKAADWILPWDGNCFLTEGGWEALREAVLSRPDAPYFVTPMTRVLDNGVLLDPDFSPDLREEPQLVFHKDAAEEFDERLRYGRRPKVTLLCRLGVPGPWDDWPAERWEEADRRQSPDHGRFGTAGWVARLFSGATEQETDGSSRMAARTDAIMRFLDGLDRRRVEPALQGPLRDARYAVAARPEDCAGQARLLLDAAARAAEEDRGTPTPADAYVCALAGLVHRRPVLLDAAARVADAVAATADDGLLLREDAWLLLEAGLLLEAHPPAAGAVRAIERAALTSLPTLSGAEGREREASPGARGLLHDLTAMAAAVTLRDAGLALATHRVSAMRLAREPATAETAGLRIELALWTRRAGLEFPIPASGRMPDAGAPGHRPYPWVAPPGADDAARPATERRTA